MKKTVCLLLCAVLAAACLTGCVTVNFAPGEMIGQGDLERHEFAVGKFTSVRVSTACDVVYYAGSSDTVTLDIHPNLWEYMEIEVKDGELHISSSRMLTTGGSKMPVVTVTAPELTGLRISGAGTFKAHDKIVTDRFDLNLSGASTGSVEIEVRTLYASMSGAGAFTISGQADNAELNMSGAGQLDAIALYTRDADVKLSGVGNVSISCSDNLRIQGSGVGSIEYRGSPSIDLNKSGLINIKQVR